MSKADIKDSPSPEELVNAEKTETIITKCPQCGGNMVYSPEDHLLKCEYCGYGIVKELNNYSDEIDLDKLFEDKHNEWGQETHVFHCNNCGATEILSRKEIAKKCSFCGTTNVVEVEDVSGLKPNAVLPFLFDKTKACDYVIAWARKKLLAPKAFKTSVTPEETYGNFYPAFTFDSDTFSTYKGELGEYYYVTKRVNGKTVRERKVKWFHVSGTHSTDFDDILVQAINDKKQKYINGIKPFDTNHSQEYSPDFLQGFSATQYSKDGKTCWAEAKNTMSGIIRTQILSKHHHDVVKYLNVSTTYSDSTYKYVLLPVYVGHCDYSKKIYNYFVNGQSGKVSGKTPVSAIKVMFIILAILILVAAVLAVRFLGGE